MAYAPAVGAPPPLGPAFTGEEEFQSKEKEITDVVIKVISLAKKENQEVINEELKASVVEACKKAVAETLAFQNTMKGCRRPYITHSQQLEACLKAIDSSLLSVEDAVLAARSESGAGDASPEVVLKELHEAREAACETIAEFRRWLYTNDASYLFATDRSLDAEEPVDPDKAKQDMLRAPRWMIQALVKARRGMMQAERQWSQNLKEVNELKQKVAQLSDTSALKEEIRKKDELIKKLNSGLRMLYQDMEKKTNLIKEQEEELKKRAEQIKQIVALQKDKSAADQSATAATIAAMKAAQEAAESQVNRLQQELAKAEEENKRDKAELQKLRGEVQRLKYLLKEAGSRLSMSPSPSASSIPSVGSSPSITTPPPASVPATPASPTPSVESIVEPPPPPPPELASVTPYLEAQYWLTSSLKRKALSTLLLQENDWSFIDTLGKSLQAGQEAEETAKYLVKLFIKQDIHMQVLEYLIKQEVARTKAVNTLFRGEELSSRVLRVYTRKRGKKYAHKVLYDLIKEVSDLDLNLEIDPNRVDPSTNLKQNFLALEALAQKFLDRIFMSFQWVPAEFLKLCNTICVEASKRFEKCEDLAVAGFIFLRFLCPAITAPETFDLPAVTSPGARRTLLLVGKILQNLANGVPFKEDYLAEMNRFLHKNELACQEFFKKMRTFPPAVDGDSEFLQQLENVCFIRREKIRNNLEQFGIKDRKYDFTVSTRLDERARMMLSHLAGATPESLEQEPHKVQAFASMLMDNEDFLPQLCIVMVKEQDKQLRKALADSLVTISQASNEMEFLARSIVQTEVSHTAYDFLYASFTREVFQQYTTRYCADWLHAAVGEHVNNIIANNVLIELDESRLPNDEARKSFGKASSASQLLEISRTMLDGVLASLSTAPRPLWAFANILAHNTAQDPFQFLAINYICPAIQNPVQYDICDAQPGRESLRTLQLVSDVIRCWANGTATFEGVALNQDVGQKCSTSVKEWAHSSAPSSQSPQVGPPTTLPQISAAVIEVSNWMRRNMDNALVPLLQKFSSTHNIQFTVEELVNSLSARTVKPQQQSAQATATPTQTSSLSAKEAEKLRKKMEKLKKQEEKIKEKERKLREKLEKEKEKEKKK